MNPERPVPSQEWVRRRMSSQRTSGTKPESVIRRRLHSLGLRYRVGYPVPGMPRRTIDIAFTRARVAVLVDGCFWHGCPVHAVPPKNNAAWWAAKLAANRARDAETNRALEEAGWTVVRLWEHESTEDAVGTVLRALGQESQSVPPELL